ncbi:MAG: pyridoxamine 5'-phosphate oxidase family protein [Rikenellaceae bacterium]
MEKALEYLKSHKELAFATVSDNKPKIRVFQIMKQDKTTLYFATAPHKEVYKQLQVNPYVELLAMDNEISVRIEGKVYFDVEDNVCKEIFDTNDVLPRIYPDYKSMVYFRLPIKSLDYFDLKPTPPLLEHFEL